MSVVLLALALFGCTGSPDKVKSGPSGFDSRPDTEDTEDTQDTQDTEDTASPTDSGTDTADTGPLDTAVVDTGPFVTVEVGTGEFAYVPLAPNDPIEIIAGPQGGYHFLGGLRVCNMTPPFDIHFQVVDSATGTLVTDLYYWQWMLIDEGNGCRNTYNLFGYINVILLAYGDQDTPPELLDGNLVEMRMEVTDTMGLVESGAVEVAAWSQ